jgi:hypothetical protein
VYPESSLALSKVLDVEMARCYSRWTGIPLVGLRFSNNEPAEQGFDVGSLPFSQY